MSNRIAAAVVTLAALTAFAEVKTKEEAQAEVYKGKTQSCEVTKKTLNPKFCADELAKAQAINCADPKSFKLDDLFALNSACVAKAKAGAPAAAAATASGSGTKTESKCKAIDGAGGVAAEGVDTSSLSCQRKLKDVLAKKCDGSTKKVQYQFVATVLGKETKPTKLTVYCPTK